MEDNLNQFGLQPSDTKEDEEDAFWGVQLYFDSIEQIVDIEREVPLHKEAEYLKQVYLSNKL